MVLQIDKTDNGSVCSELPLFQENYALLSNTIEDINDPLMKCFMEKNIFTTEEEKQIGVITIPLDKIRLLLQKILTLLKANNTRGFYVMLKVMKEHGDKGTKTLSDHIMDKLKISVDKLPYIHDDDVHLHNGKPEG